jgi:hypothetical protein
MSTSVQEVRAQLEHALTLRGNHLTLEPSLLDDYAKIGSFLTDGAECRFHLGRLSNALAERLRAANLVHEITEGGEKKWAVKTTRQVKDPTKWRFSRERFFDERIVKHHKVLTTFFAQWESLHRFNVDTNQREGERLPPRPATLTGFVHADDFRNYLLKHGYHWKDAAVGAWHGEFTHRIHWYLVVEKHNSGNGGWLDNPPVELFKALGDPKTINQMYPWNANQKKVNVWDQLFDNGDNNADLNAGETSQCPHYGKPNLFRKPENLHKFIQDQRGSPDLWALGYLIWGRAQKRKNESAEALRQRYQDYIEQNSQHLARAGFITGDNAPSLGTIIWK